MNVNIATLQSLPPELKAMIAQFVITENSREAFKNLSPICQSWRNIHELALRQRGDLVSMFLCDAAYHTKRLPPAISALIAKPEFCQTIRKLELSKIAMKDEEIAEPIKLFPHCEDLLITSTMGSQTAAVILKLSQTLKTLKLIDVAFDNESASRAQAIVQNCTNITHLDLSYCSNYVNVATSAINLTRLSLAGTRGNFDKAAEAITSRCPLITHLDLEDCNEITDDSITIAKRWTSLTHLNLSSCKKVSSSALSALVTTCATLRHLDISGCNQLTDEAIGALGPNLSYLNLEMCRNITGTAIETLVKKCQKLTYLNLSDCWSVTNEAIQAVGANCTNLTYLNLNACSHIKDDGIGDIAANCRSLIEIDVTTCPLLTLAAKIDLYSKIPGRVIETTETTGKSLKFAAQPLRKV